MPHRVGQRPGAALVGMDSVRTSEVRQGCAAASYSADDGFLLVLPWSQAFCFWVSFFASLIPPPPLPPTAYLVRSLSLVLPSRWWKSPGGPFCSSSETPAKAGATTRNCSLIAPAQTRPRTSCSRASEARSRSGARPQACPVARRGRSRASEEIDQGIGGQEARGQICRRSGTRSLCCHCGCLCE